MDDDHPIVLRFEELTPGCLGRMQMHASRAGGDPKAEDKMLFQEQDLENMMAKAPDPRNAERRARQDRNAKGDKMDR